jgi:glucose-6-phosphate 1-dehydrogenase
MLKISKTPFILTIFGASGDLAKIKIFPALYSMMLEKRLPKSFFIVGYARTKKTQAAFRKEFVEAVEKHAKEKVDPKLLSELSKHVYYFTGDYGTLADYESFDGFLKETTKKANILRLFYFSVPPTVFRPIIQNLGESNVSNHKKKVRLIIEKPFGEDAHSATELYHFVSRYFDEEQVYLLDHYLGKSAVQSILHLRHSNRILNHMLKGREISNIQITAFEDIGIKNRVGYFDDVGILKDMVQSHLLQILALVTMSIPVTERAVSVQKEKYNILSSVNFIKSGKNLSLGQYKSYRANKEVPKNSKTETFAAIRLFLDRESWYGVPIYIRTGKMLNEKHTYVVVELKKFAFQKKDEDPNRVVIELQPNEQISIKLLNKHHGGAVTQDVITSAPIACDNAGCLPEHAMLLNDILHGDKTYFLTFPEIIAAWEVVDSIKAAVKARKIKLHPYADNSGGPKSQHDLPHTDGFEWYDLH